MDNRKKHNKRYVFGDKTEMPLIVDSVKLKIPVGTISLADLESYIKDLFPFHIVERICKFGATIYDKDTFGSKHYIYFPVRLINKLHSKTPKDLAGNYWIKVVDPYQVIPL